MATARKKKARVKRKRSPTAPRAMACARAAQFDRRWFLDRLHERGLSQRKFAKAVTVDPAGISMLFRGKRTLQLDEARKFADALGIALPEVLAHAGIELDPEHRRVQVRGYISGDGSVNFFAAESEDEADGPRDLPADAFALQARTHYSKFAPMDRWLMFVSGIKQAPSTLIGQLAICGMRDQKMCVGHVRHGYKEDLFNIHMGDVVQENVSAIWAMSVLWLKPFATSNQRKEA